MTKNQIKQMQDRLEAVLTEYEQVVSKSKYDDLSDLSGHDCQRVIAMARAAVTSVAIRNSTYVEQIEYVLARTGTNDGDRVNEVAGIVEALLAELKAGYIQSAAELLHGELFGDFLEMSAHLLDEGYKDASAVIAGSALEAHLRLLCNRHNVPVSGQTKQKKPIKLTPT